MDVSTDGSNPEALRDLNALVERNPLNWAELQQVRQEPPKVPGIYAWWFSNLPPSVPLAGTVTGSAGHLSYVGVAGSNLHQRIRSQHYQGNAEGSTLRRTLGLLLSDTLGIRLELSSSGKRLTFGDGEAALTAWMAQHARVSWITHPAPRMVEEMALKHLVLPLNLAGNRHHEFHAWLSELRKQMVETARERTKPPAL